MPRSDTSFLIKVRSTIDRYQMLADGFTVIVAVSGGPDSVALLHVLSKLKQRWYATLTLHVAHLNHHLRGRESDEDERFVKELAAKLGLAFTSAERDIRIEARQRRRNVEEVAREERYRFLRDVAAHLHAQRIATGHTLTDQSETVLMRLVRGAGGEGLSAIHPVVDDLIIRPLLGVTRAEVLAYCQQLGVPYRYDRTNEDMTLFRSRIRHDILPALAEMNPGVLEALGRGAENFRLDESYFDQIVAHLLPDCIVPQHGTAMCLSIPRLNELHPALGRRVLRAALGQVRGSLRGIGQAHLRAVESLLRAGKSGKRAQLPGLTVWREFDVLRLTTVEPLAPPPPQELAEGSTIVWGPFRLGLHRGLPKEDVGAFPGAVLLDDDKIPGPLLVRTRLPGDRYVPAGHRRPRKLKRLFIDQKIPVTERPAWPIVVSGRDDTIVWVPRLPLVALVAPAPETQRFAAMTATEQPS